MAEFDIERPLGTDLAGLGGEAIRETKEAIQERMQVDHYWDNNLDLTEPDADGRHKQVTMPAIAEAPIALPETGRLYTKVVDDVTELFFLDPSGREIRLTYDGVSLHEKFKPSIFIGNNPLASLSESPFLTVNVQTDSVSAFSEGVWTCPSDGTYAINIVLSLASPNSFQSPSPYAYNNSNVWIKCIDAWILKNGISVGHIPMAISSWFQSIAPLTVQASNVFSSKTEGMDKLSYRDVCVLSAGETFSLQGYSMFSGMYVSIDSFSIAKVI